MFGIWISSDDPNAWKNVKKNIPFDILELEVEECTASVNFLDLTISINKYYKIGTGRYKKAMNPYLHPHPTFADPLIVKHGMIDGMLIE